MDAKERRPVTVEDLTALKTASEHCWQVACLGRVELPISVDAAILRADPKAVAKRLRDFLVTEVLVVRQSWNELLSYDAVECLQKFNAGLHTPVEWGNEVHATYHEGAGHLLDYLLHLPTELSVDYSDLAVVGSGFDYVRSLMERMCDEASVSMALCQQIRYTLLKSKPQVDLDRFRVALVTEWSNAVRGIETGTRDTDRQQSDAADGGRDTPTDSAADSTHLPTLKARDAEILKWMADRPGVATDQYEMESANLGSRRTLGPRLAYLRTIGYVTDDNCITEAGLGRLKVIRNSCS